MKTNHIKSQAAEPEDRRLLPSPSHSQVGGVWVGAARGFCPDSDLDVLVEFEPGHTPGLIRLAGMEIELSALLGGRKVDINTPLCLSKFFRDEVLAEAEPVYVAA